MRRIAYANYLQVGCYHLLAVEMEDHSHGRPLADPQLRLSLLCSQGSLRTVSEHLEARDAETLLVLEADPISRAVPSSLKVTNRSASAADQISVALTGLSFVAVKTWPRSASLDPEILSLSSTTTTRTATGLTEVETLCL